MLVFRVQLDRETSERAGAGGMFQVISITSAKIDNIGIADSNERDATGLVSQGTHYADLSEVRKEIAEKLGLSVEDVIVEDVSC